MRTTALAKCLSALLLSLAAALSAQTAEAQPTFSTAFSPDTIGPGGSSVLTYTITNGSGAPVTDLDFTNLFPAEITVDDPASASSTCSGGTLTATAGSGSVSYTGGGVGAGQSCAISVRVTATTLGQHTNPAITLTSSAGTSASLPDDLTVNDAVPGFSKTLSPSSVGANDTVTLTYTLDNTASANPVTNVVFTETFPTGVVIEAQPNFTTDCGGFNSIISAPAGGNEISVTLQGFNSPGNYVAAAGASCEISLAITPTQSGSFELTSSNLQYIGASGPQQDAGASSATLTVASAPTGVVGLVKDFADNAVAPGATVDLTFTLTNPSTTSAATGISFSDDLDAMLAGASVTGALPTNPCGTGSTLSGTSLLTLTGGSIAARDSCSFTVTVQVPGGAGGGDYVNTTSTVPATIDGAATTGPADTDTLRVLDAFPVELSKAFVPSTMTAGDTGQLVHTLTNPNGALNVTDVAFSDDLTGLLPHLSFTGFATTCGGFAGQSPVGVIILQGGAISAGATCTVTADFTLAAATPADTYTVTSSTVTGTFPDSSTFAGAAVTEQLVVEAISDLSGLTLAKSFDTATAGQGTTVGMTLRLSNTSETVSATQVSFTDDLDAFYAGTTLSSVASNSCGGSVSGSSTLTFTGGTVAPDTVCEIEVALTLGASATGAFGNTTSNLTAAADAGAPSELTGTAASDSLTINTYSALELATEFVDDPVEPGGDVTLRFTIENPNTDPAAAASGIVISDNLSNTLSGLTATGLPMAACGGTISGTTSLLFSGGSLAAGATCSFDVSLAVPAGAGTGSYSNLTSAVASTIDGNAYTGNASSTQLVVEADPLSVLSSFTDSPVLAGEIAQLVYTFENTSSTQSATGIAFTDAIATAIPGATFTVGGNTCGGTVSGSGTASFSGIDLAPASTCTVTLAVTVPGGTTPGDYTTSPAAGSYSFGASTPAFTPTGATLSVTDTIAPTFTKTFDTPVAGVGTSVDVTFSITNNDASTLSALAFNDDLSAFLSGAVATGLPANPCGTGSTITGTSFLAMSGATLAASETCSFSVTLTVPAGATPGDYTNTTSALTSNGLTVAAAASDSLEIVAPPAFAKAFAPASVVLDETSTMTLTIDNAAQPVAATSLDVTDNLPAGMSVATPSNAATTCTGGTLTAVNGANSVSYTGGTVGAGATCTVTVDVIGSAAGALANTTGDLTSSLGNSGPASATLTVSAAVAPTLTKAFAVSGADEGETVDMTLTVANPNAFATVGNISLTDTFPAGLEAAGTPVGDAACVGGSFAGTDGDTAVSWTGGSVVAGETCTVTVPVRITGDSDLTNTAELTSDANATAITASDTLLVTAGALPTLAKSFSETGVTQGESLTMTIEVGNPNTLVDIANLEMTDTFPADLEISTDATGDAACSTGVLAGSAGDTSLTWTGGTLAAGETCTITVGVTPTGDTSLSNTAELLSDRNTTAIQATAALAVTPPGGPELTKTFSATTAVQGETLTLTLAVTNPNSVAAMDGVTLTDTFPTGLVLAGDATADASCTGGTLTGAAGDSAIGWTGGALATGATCTVTAEVTVTGASDLTNTASVTATGFPTPVDASAALTVTPAPAPGFAMGFAPSVIPQGSSTRVTFTLDNSGALVAADAAAFAVAFDPSLVLASDPAVSNSCTGGTVTASAGASSLSLSGATIPAGASCAIGVTVTGTAVGTFTETAGPLTSSLGASGTASATLQVEAVTGGTVTFIQRADPDGTFGFTSTETLLNFSIATTAGEGSYGPVTLAPGLYRVLQSRPAGFGNAAVSCNDTDSTATAQTGEIVLDVAAGEAIICTLTSVQTDTKTVETINRFLFRRADLLLSSEPDMGRRIDRLTRGFGNASALRFATGDLMSFSPFDFDPMSLNSDTVNVSGSLLTMRQAGASLALAHGATRDTAYVSNYRWDAWFEAQYKKFDDSEGEGRFGVIYFGADYLVTENVLVGLMTSIDMITEESSANNTTVTGGGWMAGPYMTARLSPNLYFDARIAAGTSSNKISPFNTYTDSFDTSRWMAQMSLTGDYRKGPWSIRPNASLAYFQETQDGYVDSLGVAIPSQTIALGQARFGPTIAGNFVTADGLSYRPYFTLEAIYNMGTTMGVTLADDTPNSDGWRGRFQTGVSFALEDGASLSLGASYDGLFRDDYEALGFSFKFEIPLAITKAE